MKRTSAILMIGFILANVAGFYVYFVFRLKEIRKEMRAELKDYPVEKLQRIVLSASQYHEIKNDEGEIEWQGYMYDVARVMPTGNQVTVLALRDEAETNLLAFLDRVVEMTKRDNQSIPPSFTQYLSLTFTIPDVVSCHPAFLILTSQYSKQAIKHLTTVYLDVQAPPPRA